jgi:hypothetical protein
LVNIFDRSIFFKANFVSCLNIHQKTQIEAEFGLKSDNFCLLNVNKEERSFVKVRKKFPVFQELKNLACRDFF